VGLRVGIDLVSVELVAEALRDHGDRYLERVYTAREVEDCRRGTEPAPERLAARFAAKEAAIKVFRPGHRALPWPQIEVRRDPAGWVELSLTGAAEALAAELGVEDLAVSLTHEHSFASAVVVATVRSNRRLTET
jgi:holo-[acyl-carrier protein] synthase